MNTFGQYQSFIHRLITASPAVRARLLKTSNPQIIHGLCELVLNILLKNIPLTSSQTRALWRHKQIFYRLAAPLNQHSLTVKRRLLLSKNGQQAISALRIVFKHRK